MNRWIASLYGRKSPEKHRAAKTFCPALETLEQRLVPTIELSAGVLTVVGTANPDYILVRYQNANDSASNIVATRIASSGLIMETRTFASNNVSQIAIDGGGGWENWLINSTDVPAVLIGGSGRDVLKGGGAGDYLQGNGGADRYVFSPERWDIAFINGESDGFVIGSHASLGQDIVDEREEDNAGSTTDGDTLSFAAFDRGIDVRLGTTAVQTVAAGMLQVRLMSSTGIENAGGSRFADRISGNSLDNFLAGGQGDDELFGLSGDDLLEGMAGNDHLDGGSDNDHYRYQHLFISSNLGRDTIADSAGDEDLLDMTSLIMVSGPGMNLDLASLSTQIVVAGDLELVLEAADSIEWVQGTFGDDVIRGNGRNNQLTGNSGKDVFEGRAGSDVLLGDVNDDTYVFSGAANLGTDRLIDYGGNDTLDFRHFGHAITLDLGFSGVQTVSAGILRLDFDYGLYYPQFDNFETVRATAYADTIWGNDSDNHLYGYGGNDTLYGRDGNDFLYGGNGRDKLFGDAGRDRLDGGRDSDEDELTGGSGRDTFVVDPSLDEQLILDFVQGTDTLVLR